MHTMHAYSVVDTKLLTPDTLLLTVHPQHAKDRLQFSAGQYAAIGFKRYGRPSPMRCFSIISSPNDTSVLQFACRIKGRYTRALAELGTGDTVFIHGPFGNFIIDETYDKHIIMVAGGIGITPFVSMIRYATEAQLPMPITLLYSASKAESMPFLDELREHERQNPRFNVACFVTKGDTEELPGHHLLSGRIDHTHLHHVTSGQYNRFTYFICGPNGFIHAMRSTLQSHNTEPARIITEEFTLATHAQVTATPSQHAIPRWTYSLSGLAFILAIASCMVLDLTQTVPKLVHAQTAQRIPIPTTSTANSNTATTISNTPMTIQPTPTTSPSSTYQAPVTSVS